MSDGRVFEIHVHAVAKVAIDYCLALKTLLARLGVPELVNRERVGH